MTKQVVITIDAIGNSKLEAENFNGVGCAEATSQIEIILGGDNTDNKSKDFKPEFYAQAGVEQKQEW
jgi:hypothetical protein